MLQGIVCRYRLHATRNWRVFFFYFIISLKRAVSLLCTPYPVRSTLKFIFCCCDVKMSECASFYFNWFVKSFDALSLISWQLFFPCRFVLALPSSVDGVMHFELNREITHCTHTHVPWFYRTTNWWSEHYFSRSQHTQRQTQFGFMVFFLLLWALFCTLRLFISCHST